MYRHNSDLNIRNLVSQQHKEETERRRKVLLPIIDTITTLCKQNIALRGHRNEEGIINSDGIDPLLNDGNFRAISRLLIKGEVTMILSITVKLLVNMEL